MAWPEEFINTELDGVEGLLHSGQLLRAAETCEALLTKTSEGPFRDCVILFSIECAIKRKKTEGIDDKLSSLSAKYPNSPRLISLKGLLSLLSGDMVAAQSHFSDALKISNDYADALAGLGHCGIAKGEVESALHFYGKALDLEPMHQDALGGFVEAALALNLYHEAETRVLKALHEEPFHPFTRFDLARVLVATNRREEALNELQKVLTISPNFLPAANLKKELLS